MLFGLKGIRKYFGGRLVLSVDDLDIQRGDRICIVGGNGSGKSTLLRILAGITQISAGVLVKSQEIGKMRKGYVSQTRGFDPGISVQQHLSEQAYLQNVEVYRAIWPELATTIGIERYLNRPIGELSGGYQRMVILCGVFGLRPDLIFMDEPLSGLDNILKVVATGLVERRLAQAAMVAVTAHSMEEFPWCTRFVRLDNGFLVEEI